MNEETKAKNIKYMNTWIKENYMHRNAKMHANNQVYRNLKCFEMRCRKQSTK